MANQRAREEVGLAALVRNWQLLLTVGYLATCLSSAIWHSTYWHYFGLNYLQYTSITSLFLGALGQGFIVTIALYLPLLAFQFYLLQRARASPLMTGLLAVLVVFIIALFPGLHGNITACLNSRGAAAAPIGIMRDANGRELIPLPSSQEYLLYIRETGDLPTIVKRDTMTLTATGRSWGAMRERDTWWQCGVESVQGAWRR